MLLHAPRTRRVAASLVRILAAATASLGAGPVASAQSTYHAINPATRYPVAFNGNVERYGGDTETGHFKGRWICTHGIVERFDAVPLATASPASVGAGEGDAPAAICAKYFEAHPEADAVVLIGGTCPPWNPCNPAVFFGYHATPDGDMYSFPGCETDFVEFNLTIRNPNARLYGFKFSGDPTDYALRVYTSNTFEQYVSGHTFCALRDGEEIRKFGKNTFHYIPVTSGAILDEAHTQWTDYIEWPLTRARYNAATAKARELKHLSDLGDDIYFVFRQNCVEFAAKIAEAAGVDMPRYRMIVPPYSPDPGVLAAEIRECIQRNGGCHGDARPRGRCVHFGGFQGGDGGIGRYVVSPQALIAHAVADPEGAAASFLAEPTYHAAPAVSVGLNRLLTLVVTEAFPGVTALITDFGDGSAAVAVNPAEHSYSKPGAYTARVIAIDFAGLHVIEVPVTVAAKGKPTTTAIAVPSLPPLDQPINPGEQAALPDFARTFPADVSCNWVADGEDLALVLAQWGSTAVTVADIDGDGVVSGNDLAIVLAGWGSPAP